MSSIYQSSYSLCFKLSTVWICINLATASFSYTILGEIWQNLLPITQLSFIIKGGVIPSNLTNSRTFLPFFIKNSYLEINQDGCCCVNKKTPRLGQIIKLCYQTVCSPHVL